MNYIIENGTVYKIEKIGDAEIKSCFGSEKQLALISESNTEKVYEWQRFDIQKGEYVTDKENTGTANIDGKEYKPTEGKIIVKKKNTIKQLELAITEMYEDNLKLREKISQTELAITELYETMTND